MSFLACALGGDRVINVVVPASCPECGRTSAMRVHLDRRSYARCGHAFALPPLHPGGRQCATGAPRPSKE
ncbi:hypothetical protein NLX83_39670 [Allokutzneria sp. A3M-2-11 16]|uniref:hypothetical protein n=1 Tax=Allokutzneria sp. A3M-2-11 16 TaxID=2962043 RepID=UPI0020B81F90|nr:hypothetical protein [Allokutzneria sp. A3M-2-11 16]MCP3805404.1 hypothetical protein [Allokutzneria sp. A3M-2-11 16]